MAVRWISVCAVLAMWMSSLAANAQGMDDRERIARLYDDAMRVFYVDGKAMPNDRARDMMREAGIAGHIGARVFYATYVLGRGTPVVAEKPEEPEWRKREAVGWLLALARSGFADLATSLHTYCTTDVSLGCADDALDALRIAAIQGSSLSRYAVFCEVALQPDSNGLEIAVLGSILLDDGRERIYCGSGHSYSRDDVMKNESELAVLEARRRYLMSAQPDSVIEGWDDYRGQAESARYETSQGPSEQDNGLGKEVGEKK